MKIVSSLPSVLARVGDLVERDVSSAVDVEQTALFPLLSLPTPLRVIPSPLGSTARFIASCFVNIEDRVANAGVSAIQLGDLDRGVWDLDFLVTYRSNFVNAVAQDFILFLQDTVQNSALFLAQTRAYSTTVTLKGHRRITVDRSDLELRVTLAANGVGQEHSYDAVIALSRLL